MKVGVFLKSNISPSIGGNFSYYDKFIRGIDEYQFSESLEICFIGRFPNKEVKLHKKYIKLGGPLLYGFSNLLIQLNLKRFFNKMFRVNIDFCSKKDAKILTSHLVDIVLFPIQFQKAINDFPFVSMNWDAGHKTTFAFPELLEHFRERELWYRDRIQEAMAIFVESESSKKEFSTYYCIPSHKIEVVPLFPGSVVDLKVDSERQMKILDKIGLQGQGFLYYPAQFWAHKNHYNLIMAFKRVLSSPVGKNLKLVFSGSDMGNKNYIMSVIRSEKLESDILVLGFISNEEVYTLYKNAIALVMPTFLGPTNMPLLEAQAIGTPVICSDLSGHREQCEDFALYADPAKPEEWTEAILKILNPEIRATLKEGGHKFRQRSIFTFEKALASLERSLIKITQVRKTFQ